MIEIMGLFSRFYFELGVEGPEFLAEPGGDIFEVQIFLSVIMVEIEKLLIGKFLIDIVIFIDLDFGTLGLLLDEFDPTHFKLE